ncbi:hypothetical protein DFH11DRAFT_1549361 [Phellopilus nigrolimitatus]|nr:hypothetical protein DFH11DRAFT_1549361 [Phellopilus nigrolimitatus]
MVQTSNAAKLRVQSKEIPFVLLVDGPFQPVKLLEPENRRLPARDFDARRHRRDGDSSLLELSYQTLAMRKASSIEHIVYDTYRSNQLDEVVQKVSNYLPTSSLSLVYHLLIPKLILCSVIILDGEMADEGEDTLNAASCELDYSLDVEDSHLYSASQRRFNLPYSVIDGPELSNRPQRQLSTPSPRAEAVLKASSKVRMTIAIILDGFSATSAYSYTYGMVVTASAGYCEIVLRKSRTRILP